MSLALQVRTTLARTAVTSCAAACLVLRGRSSVYDDPAECWRGSSALSLPTCLAVAALLLCLGLLRTLNDLTASLQGPT